MTTFTAAQERNLREALSAASTEGEAVRLAFGIWTESRALIQANDGRNTSDSPGVTPAVAAVLRRSLALRHDAVGSNGRSTGLLQQISAEVGGGWGDMAGTMDPAISAGRFLAQLRVTDDPVFDGWLVRTDGSRERVSVALSSPIAADVLRVQQPLANEARSTNYGPDQVQIAREITARFWATSSPTSQWLDRTILRRSA